MTFKSFVDILTKRWRAAGAVFFVCVLIAVAVSILSPKRYDSTVLLYISSQSSTDNATSAYQGSLLSEQRVKSYTQLLSSLRLAEDVLQKTAVPISATELSDSVTASAQPATVLLTATVRSDSPERATVLANGVSQAFIGLVAEIEKPANPTLPPAVMARIVQPATFSPSPVSPNTSLDLLSGVIAGIVLGMCAALARESFDTSIRTVDDLRSAAEGLPNLGIVRYSAKFEQTPVIDYANPSSLLEDFRRIRVNLQFVDLDRTVRCTLVTSALANEGKSTFVCNFAVALAQAGLRVIVVEADLRRPRAGKYLKIPSEVGLTNVLAGQIGLREAVVQWRGTPVSLLPSGPTPPNPTEMLGSSRMSELLESLRSQYDFVLMDSPPVLPVADAAALAPLCDSVLLVASARLAKHGTVSHAVNALKTVSAPMTGTVLTLAANAQTYGGYRYRYYTDDDQTLGETSKANGTSGGSVQNRPSPAPRQPNL